MENGITDIPSQTFRVQHNLKRLFLQRNFLHTINPDTFSGLTSLAWLNLAENRFNDFPLSELENMTQLELLDMTNNQLTLDGSHFPHLANIFEMYALIF